jgi:flavin reductase (DIM6/NTAB) family NADH-FMN oxidoreductase RutF
MGAVAGPVAGSQPTPMTASAAANLRAVLGSFTTGVTVVTVGHPVAHGMTANSFTSVSLEPPLVLVCVDRAAAMHRALLASAAFAVSVLSADQEGIARYFAGPRPHGAAQFDRVRWSPGDLTGAPLIGGALAWFECGLWRAYDGGDHSIFVGRLLSVRRCDAEALVFFSGRFQRLPHRHGDPRTVSRQQLTMSRPQ